MTDMLEEFLSKSDNYLVVLSVFVFAVIISIIFLYQYLKPKYLSYVEDDFYNLKWKWRWRKGKVTSLWAYCPDCDSSLICDDESCKNHNNLKDKITFFICDNCNLCEKGRVVGGNREYVLKIIEREIMKKVSKGDFKTEKDGV